MRSGKKVCLEVASSHLPKMALWGAGSRKKRYKGRWDAANFPEMRRWDDATSGLPIPVTRSPILGNKNHLPVTLKTTYADGPLCGFSILFLGRTVPEKLKAFPNFSSLGVPELSCLPNKTEQL